jgi:predicted signal transduction protein with EAL and GGDEF domain
MPHRWLADRHGAQSRAAALAKGVQSGEQARFLLREGCAEVQGHLYARSLRAAEFELYLQGRDLARTDEPGRARGMGGNVQKSTGRRKLRRA